MSSGSRRFGAAGAASFDRAHVVERRRDVARFERVVERDDGFVNGARGAFDARAGAVRRGGGERLAEAERAGDVELRTVNVERRVECVGHELLPFGDDMTCANGVLVSVPEIIARPPWPAARKRNVLALEVPKRGERVVWASDVEQHEWSHPGGGVEKTLQLWEREEIITKLASRDIVRIDAATNLERGDLERALRECDVRFIDHYGLARALFAKYGTSTIDTILELVPKATSSALEVLLRFDAIDVPVRVKSEYLVERWIERFPKTATEAFLPAALGPEGKSRKAALHAIQQLRKAGHELAIREAAASFGDEAAAEVDALFAPEPLPSRAPRLPEWALAKLPMPRTKDDEAIGDEPRERLVQLLSLLPLDAAKNAIELVKSACEAESLATLGLALAQAWVAAGAETKHKWALLAAGALGDDIAARKLADWTIEWAKAGVHPRSRAALEALSLVGTDVALMHTDRIARTMKGALQENATATLDAIAKARNLSQEELGDRLVPSLGLDPSGSTWLDFGKRRFRVSFDEALVPELFDETGERLARLPRATKDDDDAKAARAIATFKGFQSDAKKIAPDQVRRLERAMCTEREWSAAEFRTFFLDHPLMVHLARRLVWLTDQGITFRIIEDRAFAGEDDRERTLPDDARIRIAHPLAIAGGVAAWSTTFTDYLIVQPFPQLGRETFAIAEDERDGPVVKRFEGRAVPGSRFFALKSRGWGFYDYSISKLVRGNFIAILDSDPGLEFLASKPLDQTLGALTLRRESGSPARFSDLEPIDASELVRDVELLVK